MWFTHGAPALASVARGDHRAGIGVASGPLKFWLEARDRPLRGGVGFEARVLNISTAVGIESHPVLGETVSLMLGLGTRASSP